MVLSTRCIPPQLAFVRPLLDSARGLRYRGSCLYYLVSRRGVTPHKSAVWFGVSSGRVAFCHAHKPYPTSWFRHHGSVDSLAAAALRRAASDTFLPLIDSCRSRNCTCRRRNLGRGRDAWSYDVLQLEAIHSGIISRRCRSVSSSSAAPSYDMYSSPSSGSMTRCIIRRWAGPYCCAN